MGGLKHRLAKLEGAARPTPEDEREREREMIRDGAERTNRSFLRDKAIERRGELLDAYGTLEAMSEAGRDWSDEALTEGAVPPFVIADEGGGVFCSRDGKPVTDFRQTLAEVWYWRQVELGNPGRLIHDEEAQAFYTPEGELALNRDLVDLRHFFRNL